ncbi:MAG: UDP-N-acetylglucosamine 2-epimerase (non-hydrolyzing) [Gammaproteobacteria bacterium]|nr:UDP-N-acetylglucosamine 2-epimerase (non-hydrolyzing) [Gammaproteobacteria bacterium]MDH5693877.1 UDP-N-acetylglucosamine 2-epimerase (non-hydrolyzing) [Gammaproteobacteria bacterium]
MKILTVIGARPQFVKAAAVSRAISTINEETNSRLSEFIVHTGQHYDQNMSDIFFDQMKIPKPNLSLEIGGLSHGAMTGRMLENIEATLKEQNPDLVLVYGDTNSTLAGALAAVKLHIPVAHVEAGLRSFNRAMPEEINRVVTDHVASWLFCPTSTAVDNLKQEGIVADEERGIRVSNVGDVMFDTALFYKNLAGPSSYLQKVVSDIAEREFVLATIHRQENTDDSEKLSNIVKALVEIGSNTPIVLPLHPRTKKIISEQNLVLDGIHVVEPLGYFDMIYLLERCKGVMTDSGGLQKEAYFFKKPCVTLREQTEWVELVDNGFNRLAGSDRELIVAAFDWMSMCKLDYSKRLYGDGNASHKIVSELLGLH